MLGSTTSTPPRFRLAASSTFSSRMKCRPPRHNLSDSNSFHEPKNAVVDYQPLTQFRFMVPFHAQSRKEAAHEPQNACADYQVLTHFEVHGRYARNTVPGKSHFGFVSEGRARHSVRAGRPEPPIQRRVRSGAPNPYAKMSIASAHLSFFRGGSGGSHSAGGVARSESGRVG